MASDFQRPRSWMMLVSMRATRRAVAPPGRRERAESRLDVRPVVAWMRLAAWRKALVMKVGRTSYQLRCVGAGL